MPTRKPIVVAHRANSGRIVSWYKRLGVKWVEIDAYWDEDARKVFVGHPPSPIQRATILGRAFSAIDYLFFYRNPLYGRHSLRSWIERLDFAEGVVVDLKNRAPLETLAQLVESIAENRRAVIVTSSDHDYLLELKQRHPWINIAPSIPIKSSILLKYLAESNTTHLSILYTLLDRETIEALHSLGVEIIAWTVNSPQTAARLAEIGADYIVTDRPDKIKP